MAENVGEIYSDFVLRYSKINENMATILGLLAGFDKKAEKAGRAFGLAFNTGLDAGLAGSNVERRIEAILKPLKTVETRMENMAKTMGRSYVRSFDDVATALSNNMGKTVPAAMDKATKSTEQMSASMKALKKDIAATEAEIAKLEKEGAVAAKVPQVALGKGVAPVTQAQLNVMRGDYGAIEAALKVRAAQIKKGQEPQKMQTLLKGTEMSTFAAIGAASTLKQTSLQEYVSGGTSTGAMAIAASRDVWLKNGADLYAARQKLATQQAAFTAEAAKAPRVVPVLGVENVTKAAATVKKATDDIANSVQTVGAKTKSSGFVSAMDHITARAAMMAEETKQKVKSMADKVIQTMTSEKQDLTALHPTKPIADDAKTTYDATIGKSWIHKLVNESLAALTKLKTNLSGMSPFAGVATNAKLVSDQVEAEVKQMRAEVEAEIRKIQAISRAKINKSTDTLTARYDTRIAVATDPGKQRALIAERDALTAAYTRSERAQTRANVANLRTTANLTEEEMRTKAAAKAAEELSNQQEKAAKRPMQALQGFNSFMGNATAKVDQFGTRLIWSGRIMQNWSRDIWYNLVRPLQMYGTQMMQFFADLEQRVVKAATQIPHAAVGAADAIMKSVLGLSTKLPVAANDLADVYYYILSTLPKLSDAAKLAQAPGIAERIGQLAVAGGAPAIDTAKAVITVMNAMGLASEDSTVTMANMDKILDMMFATVRVGKFDLTDFVSSLGQVVSFGKEAGASIEEIFATLAAGSLVASPGQASTWAANMFKSFTQETRRQAWRDLGIEISQTVRGAMDMEWAPAGLGEEQTQELEAQQGKLEALRHKELDKLASYNQKLNTLFAQRAAKRTDSNQAAIDNTESSLNTVQRDYDVLSDNVDDVAARIAELQAKAAIVIWQAKPGAETIARSPVEMLKDLSAALDRMPNVEDRLKAIGEIFPNIRGAQAAFSMLRTIASGELATMLEEIANSTGGMKQAFKDMSATLQMQGTLLMSTVMEGLSNALKPYIGRQGILYDIAVKFTEFAKSLGQIDPKRIREIVGALLGIVGLAGAGVLLGGVATGLGFLVTILAGLLSGPGLVAIVAWFFLLRPALEGVLPAIDAAGGGIDGIAKAFAALGVALGLWKPQEAVDFLSKMGIEVKTTELTVGPLADKVRTLAKDLGGLKTNIDNITNGFQRFFTMIVENQGAIASLLAVLAGLRLVGAIGGAAEGISKLFGLGAAASTAGGVAAGGGLAASTAGALATVAPTFIGAMAGGAGIGGALLAMLTAPLSVTVGLVVASVIAAGVIALIVNELIRGTPLEDLQNIGAKISKIKQAGTEATQTRYGIEAGITTLRGAGLGGEAIDAFEQKLNGIDAAFRKDSDIIKYNDALSALNASWHEYMMTLMPATKALKDATLQAQWMAQDLAAQSSVSMGVSKGESYLSTTLAALSAAIQKRAAEDLARSTIDPAYKSGFDVTKVSTELQGYKDKFTGLQDSYGTGKISIETYESAITALNATLATFAENVLAMTGSFVVAGANLKSNEFSISEIDELVTDLSSLPIALQMGYEEILRKKDIAVKTALDLAAGNAAWKKARGLSAGDETVGGEAGVGGGLTLIGALKNAFPNAAAALAWRNAFKQEHGGADPTLTNLRDRAAGERFFAKFGVAPTDEQWKQRYYKGSFEGVDESGLDVLFGDPGTWKTLLSGQAEAENKLQGEWIAAFNGKMDAVAATIVNGINIKLGGGTKPEDHTGKRQIKMTDSPGVTKWWPVGEAPPDGWEEMAKGGYALKTFAKLGEKGREFVMDAPTTALFERQVGMLNQSKLADLVTRPSAVMLRPAGSTFNVSGANININGNVGTAQIPMIQAALSEANDALVRDMERKLQRNANRRWA